MEKPAQKPHYPYFSSGPCAKPPGWSFDNLKNAALSRSHRSGAAVKKLQEVIDKSRQLLEIPDDYLIGIVPASDTGAVEMAMWCMLGQRGVADIGFFICPLPMKKIMSIADKGKIVPKKSTYFDPKPADGLVNLLMDI